MRSYLIMTLLLLFGCGRPSSSEQETSEAQVRGRQEVLSADYAEVSGTYSGTLELIDDGSIFNAEMILRVVQDVDSTTGLPLQPKIAGSMTIYEQVSRNETRPMISYGITNGSFDGETNQIALDVSEKLRVRGIANNNVINATLHSETKGDVGKFELVRSE